MAGDRQASERKIVKWMILIAQTLKKSVGLDLPLQTPLASLASSSSAMETLMGSNRTGNREDAHNGGKEVVEAELLLHPDCTPVQVGELCDRLKAQLKAEILSVVKSDPGTVVRVSCRSELDIMEFITGAKEVVSFRIYKSGTTDRLL